MTNEIYETELFDLVDQTVENEAQKDQDGQLMKFIQGRKRFIDLKTNYTKKELDLGKFQSVNDKIIVLLSIVLLKNVNNLLIELGIMSILEFLKDLKKQLLDTKDLLHDKIQ